MTSKVNDAVVVAAMIVNLDLNLISIELIVSG